MAAEQRIARLRGFLAEQEVDAYLCTHTADIRWLTGFEQVFDSEQAHLALITADGAWLKSDSRYGETLRKRNHDGLWQISDQLERHSAYAAGILRDHFQGHTAKLRIGIESDIRLDFFRALDKALTEELQPESYSLIEVKEVVVNLRAVKDAEEIALLRQAQAFTDAAFMQMLAWLKPGQSEREAALELEYFLRQAGADGLAFPSIVASGPNSAVPHAVPTERRFERGDFVLLDFGARYLDYCSDMTRTVVLGPPSKRQRAQYGAALTAQAAVRAALKAGVSGREMHGLAAAVIDEAGFPGAFIHSLGHGVGIDIHELPLLAPKAEQLLTAGNVVTVEPGIYLSGEGGVRIEDFGLVTEDGFESFTASPHELLEL
jgi:Xaa-Pro aminopeptidase